MDETQPARTSSRKARGAPVSKPPHSSKTGTVKAKSESKLAEPLSPPVLPEQAPDPSSNITQPGASQEGSPPRAAPQPTRDPQATPDTPYRISDPTQFAENVMRLGQQAQSLFSAMMQRHTQNSGPVDPLNIAGAISTWMSAFAADPKPVIESSYALWNDYRTLWDRTARRMMGEDITPLVQPAAGDKRFRDKDWQENQLFDFIKQSYLLTSSWLQDAVTKVDGLDEGQQKRMRFFTRQFADAISPSNFVLTNPEVLRTTLQSNGENLVKGFDHLRQDMERGGIRQTADNFKVGENLALTPGKVVYRNDLLELLQYEPSTEQVYERPLLIFPPWINKFYILDLRPENSFIKWLTAQGYTVFVASWVNPDGRLAKKTFEDYMKEGVYAALEAVEQATGVRDPNVVGYCIGGTLVSTTMAYMAAEGDNRIHSATFWAAQADFTDPGELAVFVDDTQLEALQSQMQAAGGVLEGSKMATTFNLLRANDLIWSFVINNYLLGKEPVPFDLLYWNSDTTRMPEKTHIFYLREFYKNNALAKGRLQIGGRTLDLKKVTAPIYMQSAREDHIAPYRSVYRATQLYGGPVRFVLAGSGHIAGVINAPAANKYQYWTNETLPPDAEDWRIHATEHKGSWWPDWDQWLSKLSGKKIPARKPGDGKLKPLCNAPGTYVNIKGR